MLPYINMVEVIETTASSILTPQKVGSLAGWYDYTLNPYAGCAFSCSYCYVPKFPSARHANDRWGSWVEVKTNAAALIRRDRQKVFGSRIFFSSATDPYQYLELKYRLTRRCLEELLRYRPRHVTMHTRSHLMLQDLELLKSFGPSLRVGVSITTDDDDIRSQFEPMAPSIERRLALISQLTANGIEVYCSLSPLLPCNPDRLVTLLRPHVEVVWIDTMNWLEVMSKPELLEKYSHFFAEESYRKTIDYISRQFPERKNRRTNASRVQAQERLIKPEDNDASLLQPEDTSAVLRIESNGNTSKQLRLFS